MIIRRYLHGEEAAIWQVYFRATHESNARDYHRDLLNRWAPQDLDPVEWAHRLQSKNPFVALSESQIVGMAELDDTGFIDYFYVHPDYQRQGVGSALLSTLETEARDKNLVALAANVSLTAKAFFEFRGFTVVEARTQTIIGHPAPNFGMRKLLRAP